MAISWIVFACVFAGALLGMFLRARLPEPHLSAKSEDVLKMLVGLVGTMSALVIGLLIATAASSYSTRRTELMQASANIVLLDRVLAHYGPETKEARDQLQRTVVATLHTAWPENGAGKSGNFAAATSNNGEVLYETIQQLEPRNDVQRSLKVQALTMVVNLGQTRWLLVEQGGSSIPVPFVVVLTFWLAIIFVSFGIFTPPNATMFVALFLGALSVSGAIFMILELDQPFGVIQLSSAPLRNALAHLGK